MQCISDVNTASKLNTKASERMQDLAVSNTKDVQKVSSLAVFCYTSEVTTLRRHKNVCIIIAIFYFFIYFF